jgi:arginine deiminase
VGHAHGADSEVGALRAVLVHRPGLELRRMTPRARDRLLFSTLPWPAGAQREHDSLTRALRESGAEVLYVTELLQDALEYQAAREQAIGSALRRCGLGDALAGQVRDRLDGLSPEDLAQALIAGLLPEDLPGGDGLAYQLLRRGDFVIDPLPNLVFTRDSSFWVGDQFAVTSLAAPGRRREADLLGVIYAHHPRFSGVRRLYGPELEPVDGGDVVLLAPGVLAVGVGQRTTSAGAERLTRRVLDAGLAHAVLAIPVDQAAGSGYLDTLCTVIDAGSVLMHPATAYTLTAHVITAGAGGRLRVSRAQPFLEAAAGALGVDRLRIIETGLDPGTGRRGQWDDGGNALVLGPGVAVCHERSTETIARLEAVGVAVIRVPGSELASSRGGPRCMSCAIGRDPVAPSRADPAPRRNVARLAEPAREAPIPSALMAAEPVSCEPVSCEPVSCEPVSREPVPAEASAAQLAAV